MSSPGPTPSNGLQSAQQQIDELEVLIQRMLTLPGTGPEESALPSLREPLPAPPAPLPAPAQAPLPREEAVMAPLPPLPEETFSAPLPPLPQMSAVYEAPARSESPAAFTAPAEFAPLLELPELPELPPLTDDLPSEFHKDDSTPLASFEFGHDGIETSDYLPPAEMPRPGYSAPTPPAPIEMPTPGYTTDDVDDVDEPDADEPPPPPPVVPKRSTSRHGVLIRANQAFDRWTYPLGTAGHWLRSMEGRGVLGWVGVALLMIALIWGILDWMGWIW
jgi:hypothetical protein